MSIAAEQFLGQCRTENRPVICVDIPMALAGCDAFSRKVQFHDEVRLFQGHGGASAAKVQSLCRAAIRAIS